MSMQAAVLTALPKGKAGTKQAVRLPEHIVEVIRHSGKGRSVAARRWRRSPRAATAIWTVEIIGQIRPPRGVAGASGIRIRIG
jgi:hypothetical protein